MRNPQSPTGGAAPYRRLSCFNEGSTLISSFLWTGLRQESLTIAENHQLDCLLKNRADILGKSKKAGEKRKRARSTRPP